MTSTILIVDDDSLRDGLRRAFERRRFEVLDASGTAAALDLARCDCRITYASVDLRMSGDSGLVLVRELKRLRPDVVIVVLTGYGSIATAVEAIRLGATTYLSKPADARDLLVAFGLLERTTPSPASEEAYELPSLARAEWEYISRVVAECDGNISKAARLLRIERRSLQRKLGKYPVSR